MSGMIRVSRDFPANALEVKSSSRRGIPQAPLASLGRAGDDPLPRRGDSLPKKKKRKRAAK